MTWSAISALSAPILVAASIVILAHYAEPRRDWVIYVFKPLTLLLILGLALGADASAGSRYQWGIVVGLVFSLAGDVFLMLPRERFLAGLASFFVTHLAYLWAFTEKTGVELQAGAMLLGIPALAVLLLLWPRLSGRLRIAVVLYVVVLVAMAAQAIGRFLLLGGLAPLAAAAGGALFVASDSLLAVDRFRWPFRASRALVLGTYYPAQWLIAVSVALPSTSA